MVLSLIEVWIRMVPWPLIGMSGETTSCLTLSIIWRMWHTTGNVRWWGHTHLLCILLSVCLPLPALLWSFLILIPTTTTSVDVGHRWAADSPRWIFRRGEEVWLCLAASDGWGHGWICVSDWNSTFGPSQSLPTGRDLIALVIHTECYLCVKCFCFSQSALLYAKWFIVCSARFMVQLISKGTYWAVFDIWWKRVELSRCGEAMESTFLKLPQKLLSSSQPMNRWGGLQTFFLHLWTSLHLYFLFITLTISTLVVAVTNLVYMVIYSAVLAEI